MYSIGQDGPNGAFWLLFVWLWRHNKQVVNPVAMQLFADRIFLRKSRLIMMYYNYPTNTNQKALHSQYIFFLLVRIFHQSRLQNLNEPCVLVKCNIFNRNVRQVPFIQTKLPRITEFCSRTLPADLRVPAATLVETYSTSTQYLLHILSTNTRILLCKHNSIIFNHIHHVFSLIMAQILN